MPNVRDAAMRSHLGGTRRLRAKRPHVDQKKRGISNLFDLAATKERKDEAVLTGSRSIAPLIHTKEGTHQRQRESRKWALHHSGPK